MAVLLHRNPWRNLLYCSNVIRLLFTLPLAILKAFSAIAQLTPGETCKTYRAIVQRWHVLGTNVKELVQWIFKCVQRPIVSPQKFAELKPWQRCSFYMCFKEQLRDYFLSSQNHFEIIIYDRVRILHISLLFSVQCMCSVTIYVILKLSSVQCCFRACSNVSTCWVNWGYNDTILSFKEILSVLQLPWTGWVCVYAVTILSCLYMSCLVCCFSVLL